MIDEKMNISTFEEKKVFSPFLSAPIKFIPGQDPLGLLNPGGLTYEKLLPGLNNVTERIRYYSFYCWFFHFYAQHIRIPSKKTQFKYLRRAEFILAMIAAKTKVQGVSGITKATQIYNDETEIFDLKEGTGENEDVYEGTYWKNPKGVFGQNYVSSLKQDHMGLIIEVEEENEWYIRSKYEDNERISGYKLAVAFEHNIGKTAVDTLISAIITGKLSKKQLEVIASNIDMLQVPKNSDEHKLLWDLLTGPDIPNLKDQTYYRRSTIKLLLQKISKSKIKVNDLDFVFDAYHNKGKINNKNFEPLHLWYYYQIDQLWHIISTGIFSAFLNILNEKANGGWINEDLLINEISNEVLNFCTKNKVIETKQRFKDVILLKKNEEFLISKIKNEDPIGKMSYSLLLLKKIMVNNEDEIEDLLNLSKTYNLNSYSNFISSYQDLFSYSKLSLKDFFSRFLKKYIIVRHQWVALKKMEINQSTEKFIREDGLIRFINLIDYGFSSPRINTLLKFLHDLNIINSNNELTPQGEIKLKEFSND